MEEYQRLARELGAQVVVLKDKNVADALIEFAQQESISHVVFGQSVRSRFDILLHGSVINRFLAEIRDATVQVVPIDKGKRCFSWVIFQPEAIYGTAEAEPLVGQSLPQAPTVSDWIYVLSKVANEESKLDRSGFQPSLRDCFGYLL